MTGPTRVAAHTRHLAELGHADVATFGGKSASLGELIGAGIPVPPGFGIATTAFAELLGGAGLDAFVDEAVAALDVGDVAATRAAAAGIGDAITGTPVPDAVVREIEERYADLARHAGEPEPPVAVRSSALGEDGAEAAFAGQQETFLWVRGAERVAAAVRDCWASLFSATAISYRARLGDPAVRPAMGVAVQLMVDAGVSGVLFTCNPVSGDPSVVAVNASWGLGLAVVGGEVTPDDFLVSKVTGEVVRSTVSRKAIEYRPDGSGQGAVAVAVPEDRALAPCLAGDDLAALVDLARTVQRHFGSHQDVEWAIARGGRCPHDLHVLQSRPVTATGAAAEAAPAGVSAMSLIMSTFGVTPKRS